MTKDSLLNRFDDLLNEYVSELDLDALKKVDETEETNRKQEDKQIINGMINDLK